MEMNTRIQVEHPVTELVTGVDLVKEQIRVAAGEQLFDPAGRLRPVSAVTRSNAASTRRIPRATLRRVPVTVTILPSAGRTGCARRHARIRGLRVPPYYDSLIAKLIVHGNTREEAIARMRIALESFIVEGVHTTIPFLLELLQTPEFVAGDVDTKFVERRMAERKPVAVA